jgi:hypothetical protein
MNKLRLLLIALAGLMVVACENGKNNDLPKNPDSTCFKGKMTVDQNDGTFYVQTDVEVDYEIKDGKLNFVMYKVKFASGMPVKLDMVVEGASYEETANGCTISGDKIVPYAMGGPFEQFTITNLVGSVNDNKMTLSFVCGGYPVEYEGTK